MKATIIERDGKKFLQVEMEMQEPTPSATGKTLVVASSRGNKATAAEVNGQPVVIGINAYIQK